MFRTSLTPRATRRFVALLAALSLTAGAILVTAPAQAVGHVDTFGVGDVPNGVAIKGSTAYVTNSGPLATPNNTVSVVNLITGATITTLNVGSGPQAAVLSPNGLKVYVANRASSTVSVISTVSNSVTNTITVGAGPFDIAFSPDGSRAYVSRYDNSGLISVINTATETTLPSIIDGPGFAEGVAVSPDGLTLYVTGTNLDRFYLVDLTTNIAAPTGIVVGDFPTSVAVSPDGLWAYVVNNSAGTVSVFDANSLTVVNTITVGSAPLDMVVSADGRWGYVTNNDDGSISVINLVTQTEVTQLSAGDGPAGVAISADGRTVVATNALSDTISLYRLAVDRVTGTNRYGTAIAISQKAYPSPASVPVVFVATGTDYPDALAAGPVAAKLGGPVILTDNTVLAPEVKAEIQRLNPGHIYVVGGPDRVSNAILANLNTIATAERITGSNRFETSQLIANLGWPTTDPATVYVANGLNFPDALAAGAAGAVFDSPVLLVNGPQSTVDAGTLSTLAGFGSPTVHVVGGTNQVTDGIRIQLGADRITGTNRYETALFINEAAYAGGSASRAIIATGVIFPDALAASAWAGVIDAPLYLSNGTCVSQGLFDHLVELGVSQVTLVGGPDRLNQSVFDLVVCP